MLGKAIKKYLRVWLVGHGQSKENRRRLRVRLGRSRYQSQQHIGRWSLIAEVVARGLEVMRRKRVLEGLERVRVRGRER